jgi:hypothetical protein
MNNVLSEPSLVLPEIPTNFESMAGTSRTDFLRAIFDLLEGTKITGITVESSPYDLEALTAQVQQLQADVDAIKLRQVRKMSLSLTAATGAGALNVILISPPLDNANYVVSVQFRTAPAATAYNWLVRESPNPRTVSSFEMMVIGAAGSVLTDMMIWQVE